MTHESFVGLMIVLGAVSFMSGLTLTPLIRDGYLRLGIIDTADQHRKHHVGLIPRVGGLAVAASYVLAFIVVYLAPGALGLALDDDVIHHSRYLVFAACVVFLTGFVDDLFGLRPWQKLTGQALASIIACLGGATIGHIGGWELPAILNYPLTIFWLIGCANAFNLIDGMDGLAAGVGTFATLSVVIAAVINQDWYLAIATLPLAGALLGFLRYNFNPASIFLGDSGSLTIGFLLGCFGAIWTHKTATLLGLTAPLMAMSIPLLDTVLAITRRFLRHQPIFSADRGHIHHKLLERGLTVRSAALVMYAVCGGVAILSLLQNTLYDSFGSIILILFCVGVWIGVQNLGYVEFAMARRLFLAGTFRHIIDSQTRIRKLQDDLAATRDTDSMWAIVSAAGRSFGFSSVRLREGHDVYSYEDPAADATVMCTVEVSLGLDTLITLRHPLKDTPDQMIIGMFATALHQAFRRTWPATPSYEWSEEHTSAKETAVSSPNVQL